MNTQETKRYSGLSIALHWLMALLIVAAYATIELREYYPRGSDIREGLKTWHYMIGLSVLALVVVRIVAHLATPTPPITPSLPLWQAMLSKLVHLTLYLMMIGLPIAGWLVLSASGDPIPFFGLELPPLMAESESWAERIEELHETVGEVGYYVIGFHTFAALFHHYFIKDNTLLRMLPGRARAG